jgi:hypothetical protein
VVRKRQIIQVMPPDSPQPFPSPVIDFNLNGTMAEAFAIQTATLKNGETISGVITPTQDGGINFTATKRGPLVELRELGAQVAKAMLFIASSIFYVR